MLMMIILIRMKIQKVIIKDNPILMIKQLQNSQLHCTTETFSIECDDLTASTCSHLDVYHYRPNKFEVKSRNKYIQQTQLAEKIQNELPNCTKGPFLDKLFKVPLSMQYKIDPQGEKKIGRLTDCNHSPRLKPGQGSKLSLGDSLNRKSDRILFTDSRRKFSNKRAESKRILNNLKPNSGILKSPRQNKAPKYLKVSFSPEIDQAWVIRNAKPKFEPVRNASPNLLFSCRDRRQRPSSIRSLS